MKAGGISKIRIIIYIILSGITTGIGAFFGAFIGNISKAFVSVSLAFAAGAMLYIVSGELIPESNKLYKGRFSSLGNMLGIILGIFINILILSKQNSFGIDILSPYIPLNNIKNNQTLYLDPVWKREKRSKILNTKKPHLEKHISMKWRNHGK